MLHLENAEEIQQEPFESVQFMRSFTCPDLFITLREEGIATLWIYSLCRVLHITKMPIESSPNTAYKQPIHTCDELS